MLIPTRPLIAAESLGAGLPAQLVAEAIGHGLVAGGAPEPDLCPIAPDGRARRRSALCWQSSTSTVACGPRAWS